MQARPLGQGSISGLLPQSFEINRRQELRYNEQRPVGSYHCHQAAGPKENPRAQNREMGSHPDSTSADE